MGFDLSQITKEFTFDIKNWEASPYKNKKKINKQTKKHPGEPMGLMPVYQSSEHHDVYHNEEAATRQMLTEVDSKFTP